MPIFSNEFHCGRKVPLIETDDLNNKAITLDKLSDDVRSMIGKRGFSVVTVSELPAASIDTEGKLYLLNTTVIHEKTEVLQTSACDYNTINEYDEIHDSSMPDFLCFKINVVDDVVRVIYTGLAETEFSIRAIKDNGDRLVICSDKMTNVTIEQLAREINSHNHSLPWVVDADYIYAWIPNTETSNIIRIEKLIGGENEVHYEKYITVLNEDSGEYEWFDLGPAGQIDVEPTSSAGEMWTENNNE